MRETRIAEKGLQGGPNIVGLEGAAGRRVPAEGTVNARARGRSQQERAFVRPRSARGRGGLGSHEAAVRGRARLCLEEHGEPVTIRQPSPL